MKTALEKAQEEYKRRINDPSYIAPAILRNNNRTNVSENPKGDLKKERFQEFTVNKAQRINDPSSAVRDEETEAIDEENQIILANEIDDEINKNQDNYLIKLEMLKKKIMQD